METEPTVVQTIDIRKPEKANWKTIIAESKETLQITNLGFDIHGHGPM